MCPTLPPLLEHLHHHHHRISCHLQSSCVSRLDIRIILIRSSRVDHGATHMQQSLLSKLVQQCAPGVYPLMMQTLLLLRVTPIRLPQPLLVQWHQSSRFHFTVHLVPKRIDKHMPLRNFAVSFPSQDSGEGWTYLW